VLRRPGAVEPRPGFEAGRGILEPASPRTVRAIVPFEDDLLLWLSNDAWMWQSDGEEPHDAAVASEHDHVAYARARGLLFLALAADRGGVCSVADNNTAFDVAGVARARQGRASLVAGVSTAENWLADTDFAGYRLVYRRTIGTYTVRSAPSGRLYIENTTGGGTARAVSVACPLDTSTFPAGTAFGAFGVKAGDVVEVYRTRSSTVPEVGEEFALAAERTLTAADITAQTVAIYDGTPDNQLGALLYTNPSQLGDLQANDRPPLAEEIAHYKGSMFYANITTRAYRVLALKNRWAFRLWGNIVAIAGDVGVSGSTIIDNISGIEFSAGRPGIRRGQLVLEVGQTLGSAGVHIPWGTTVADVTGADSIVLSAAVTGSGVGVALVFCDTFDIDGDTFFAYTSESTTNLSGFYRFIGDAETGRNTREMLQSLAYIANSVSAADVSVLSSSVDQGEILIGNPSTTAIPIAITNEGWTPIAPSLPGTQTSAEHAVMYDVESERRAGRVYWSRADRPDAVPVVNFADVGDGDIPVRRLLPTRDALWICKDDGIYRLTGDGADAGWRIDKQSDARIVSARCADVLGSTGIVWTDAGLLTLEQTIGPRIDDPVSADLDAFAARVRAVPDDMGAFVRASRANREIYVGCPVGGGGTDKSETVHVVNADTRAWTTWNLALRDVVDVDGSLWIARPGTGFEGFGLAMERIGGILCADLSYAITLEAGETLSYEATAGSGWTPAVGDLVVRTTEPTSYAFVTEIGAGGEFELSAALTTGAGVAYTSYGSVIEWVAKTGGQPGAMKFWRSIAVYWESLFGATTAYQYSVGFKTENRPTTDATDVQVVSLVRDPDLSQFLLSAALGSGPLFEPLAIQSYVPRNHSLGAMLRPRIEIRQAGVCWRLSSLVVEGEMVGTALRRSYG